MEKLGEIVYKEQKYKRNLRKAIRNTAVDLGKNGRAKLNLR